MGSEPVGLVWLGGLVEVAGIVFGFGDEWLAVAAQPFPSDGAVSFAVLLEEVVAAGAGAAVRMFVDAAGLQ